MSVYHLSQCETLFVV